MKEKLNGSKADEVPIFIGLRVAKYEPLLAKWRQENQRVPWARLLDDGLKLALAKYAGKRHAHLVEQGTKAAVIFFLAFCLGNLPMVPQANTEGKCTPAGVLHSWRVIA